MGPRGEFANLRWQPGKLAAEAPVLCQESEQDKRLQSFQGFQVNAALMAKAPPQARFMHCLPAHRGEEVTGDVLDGEKSIAFQQAGNRMHAQKALLKWLLVG